MRRRRGLWIALAAVPVLLLVGDALYWRYAAQQLRAGFQAWVAMQRAAGWQIEARRPQLGGWPTAATLTTTDVVMDDGALAIPGGLHWTAQRLTLRVSLLHPQRLEAIPNGRQSLRPGNGPVIPFTSERMVATLPLSPDTPPHLVHIDATRLRAGPGDAASEEATTIGRLAATFDLHRGVTPSVSALVFTIDARSIALPTHFRWALGPQIAALHLDGTLHALVPADAVTPAARAVAWRNEGGTLDLRRVGLHWGPLALSGHTSLTLDQQLQPVGRGDITIVGYDAALDAMTHAGVLTRTAALAAKAVLSLMASAPDNGQPAQVDLPLRLRDHTLSVRHMPLLQLPPLDWSER